MICGKEMTAVARVNFMECQYGEGVGWGVAEPDNVRAEPGKITGALNSSKWRG